ncbi:MAG: alcohol dehydrogenase [Planctomycetaceae bacterium]|nr:alcohol dehydrogenase [Planctomycetaceae bacterium]
MRTIVLDQPGHFRMTDTPTPDAPGPGQALVRVRHVGICGSDLHAYLGEQPFYTFPRIIGHEVGMEVEQIDANDRGIAPGDRCTLNPYLSCGHCVACRHGKTNCCESLKLIGLQEDGALRERFLVPVDHLHKSETLSCAELALVEMLGIGAHAVQRGRVGSGDTVLVIGVGPIGMTVVQFALLAGARVIVMDRSEPRLDFVEKNFDIAARINPDQDPIPQLRQLTNNDMPDIVFDATGNIPSMQNAFDYIRHGGTLVLVGIIQGQVTFDDATFHRRETTLLSSRNGTAADLDRVISHLERGDIRSANWITHPVAMDDMIGSFESFLDPTSGVIKAIVEI